MSYAPPSACRDFSSWYCNVHNSTSSKPVPKIYPANPQEAKTTLNLAVSTRLQIPPSATSPRWPRVQAAQVGAHQVSHSSALANRVPSYLANCSSTYVPSSDYPSGWSSNKTFLCGLPYPAQETPLANLSNCCASPIQVVNGCFQYCEPTANTVFPACIQETLNLSQYTTICNRKPSTSGAEVQARHGGWLSGVILAAVLLRLLL